MIFLASSRTGTYLGLFKENEEEKDSRILMVQISRLVNRLLLYQVWKMEGRKKNPHKEPKK